MKRFVFLFVGGIFAVALFIAGIEREIDVLSREADATSDMVIRVDDRTRRMALDMVSMKTDIIKLYGDVTELTAGVVDVSLQVGMLGLRMESVTPCVTGGACSALVRNLAAVHTTASAND